MSALTKTQSLALRKAAWRLPEGDSAILETARDVSALLKKARVRSAVVGGVAVGLHGHLRSTLDVDVFVPAPLDRARDVLLAADYEFDPVRREFRRDVVPVQFVTEEQLGRAPAKLVEIEAVITVSLADLINMKLRSGLASILRAQDLADVIALMRLHNLSPTFAAKLDRPHRPEFRKLLRAIRAS